MQPEILVLDALETYELMVSQGVDELKGAGEAQQAEKTKLKKSAADL